jgi:quinol-cytochrome oxidoreductase complex cytochrome b subunit
LDNILIYSKDAVSHKKHVKIVLERLQTAGLQVNIKKSEFHVTHTKYLGYVLTNKGIKVDPNKVSALHNWLPPTTVTGIKSFLGFTGFYRQFVPKFLRVAKPLIALQSPANLFKWTKEC